MNGKEIKKLREGLDMSQEDFSEAVGVSKGSVGNWERGATNPRPAVIEKIEKIAGNVLKEDKAGPAVEKTGAFFNLSRGIIGKTVTVHRAGNHVVAIDEANSQAYILSRD